jgi:hypothetical protein
MNPVQIQPNLACHIILVIIFRQSKPLIMLILVPQQIQWYCTFTYYVIFANNVRSVKHLHNEGLLPVDDVKCHDLIPNRVGCSWNWLRLWILSLYWEDYVGVHTSSQLLRTQFPSLCYCWCQHTAYHYVISVKLFSYCDFIVLLVNFFPFLLIFFNHFFKFVNALLHFSLLFKIGLYKLH